jgi:hypothetical protein
LTVPGSGGGVTAPASPTPPVGAVPCIAVYVSRPATRGQRIGWPYSAVFEVEYRMLEMAFSAARLVVRRTRISRRWKVGLDRGRFGQRSDGDFCSGGRVGGVGGDHSEGVAGGYGREA